MKKSLLGILSVCVLLGQAPLLAAAENAPRVGDARGLSRGLWGYDPTADFVAFDARYPERHRQYARELRELQLELARQASSGRATPCSRQIFLEARWLVYYSAHWDKIERRLRDLREMLARPSDPPDSRDQIESDGSYDHCSEAWYLKLDSTIEEVEDRGERGEKPKFPLKLLDRINSPEKLKAYLESLLISDVRRSGLDNRFELNIAITSIERFIVGHVGQVYDFDQRMKQALFDFEDNQWQDPQTGYFGGWYRLADGSIRKTADLSITFHIVSYRRESIRRIPEMIKTTLAFRDEEYPFGWLEEGIRSNHHNYDVARIFRITWPQMSEDQRELARAEMRKMIDFCIRETLNPDGSFKMMDEDTLGSSFLFPISLLDEVGYFRQSRRFWTRESFPEAAEVGLRVEKKITALGLTDTESRKVLRRLEEVRRDNRRTNIVLALLGAATVWAGWNLWRKWKRGARGK